MASVGTATLDIVVDKQQVGKQITGAVEGSAGNFKSAAATAAKAFAGGFAAVKTFDFFKGAISEAQDAAKVMRQTNAVIASTKNASGLGASGLEDLASKLSKLSAVDDEVIQSGENVLATFTNIKGDVFKGATEAALNMSAAMGTDLQGSIVQVGKALNDPIKGISALSRVGVTFTDQQKAQIKALVDSGKTMDAQKIILKELSKEFGCRSTTT